jgi:toxin ParE1/3/4
MAGLVAESITLLGSHPEIGRLSQMPGLRELPIAGTPFLAIYRLMPKRVEIIRLLHGAQKWP